MSDLNIVISDYTQSDHSSLLRLLLELHSTYFHENASPQIQELRAERDIQRSYDDYVDMLDENKDGDWCAFIAKTEGGKSIGFIIGSIETDEGLEYGKMGKFEDWYVIPEYRGAGTGIKLYNELEKWFREKGCKQVVSDTWQGNELSVKAHLRSGFFISGVMFSKKL